VEAIQKREQLNSYYLLYVVLGEFEARLSNRQAAINYFRKSLELATIQSEQMFLSKKLQELGDPTKSAGPRGGLRRKRARLNR
jgi:RNA polymerase sigma-70 factor (ECF subfamily)